MLGILMRLVGLEMQMRQLPADPPNREAMAWLLSASNYGDKKALSLVEEFKRHITSIEFEEIKKRSSAILNDPVYSYKISQGIKIAPQHRK